jgi:NAD(P)-dependent dehydrogenase (short-subunit alcohol dehydrogenase family)
MTSRSLNGAVVAVIGASGGLGSALCRLLIGHGARVVIAGPHMDRLEGLAVALGSDSVTAVSCDLRDARCGDTIVAAAQTLGRLDGVINAAGVVAFGPLQEMPDELIEEMFLINSLGPIWLAKRVAPLLSESKGFLVNISGVIAESPLPNMLAYSASKAAMAATDAALTREYRRIGITVCDARPPHTETGLATRPLFGQAPKFPVGLSPEHVATVIVQGIQAGATELPGSAF